MNVLVAESCPALCDPMVCSPPGFSVPGNSPGKNTGVGSHCCLQGIFPTQGSNQGLLHCRQTLYRLSHQGSPRVGGREENSTYGGKSWTSQDLAKQMYSSTASSLSSKRQPMSLADSSKLIQGPAVTFDMIKVRNKCFSSDCDIQRQKDINTRQQLHHRGVTTEMINGKSTQQR